MYVCVVGQYSHWEQVGPVHPDGQLQVFGDMQWPPFRHSGSHSAVKSMCTVIVSVKNSYYM